MAGDVSSSGSSAADREPARPAAQQAPLALYRRYRPATFAEVRGQDHVTEPLRQALRSGRVHHAYLFSGPRGCGKTSSARILARSLNCEQGPTPDPCGICASCVALAPSGPGSIDVIEIDAASHGGIDDARDLRERAFYSPVAARYKIYIIDEAHMVTGAGFNALLKLVEEPPPHLKFVFATTEPEKVIPTIKSRTHHYPFRLVPPAVLRELLEEILAAEGISYEPSILPVVIRAGAGSVRDALSVLDQLIAGADESGLRYDRAIALLGYTDDALLDEMAEAFAARDGAAVFRAIDHVVEAGHDPRRFAMDLLDRLRDLIVLAAVPDAAASGLLDVPEDRLDRMRKQSAGLGEERLVRAAESISAGLVEMRGATSPRLLLELMCAQVLLPETGTDTAPGRRPAVADAEQNGPVAADVIARLERLERRISAGASDSGTRVVPSPPQAQRQPGGRRTADQPAPEAGDSRARTNVADSRTRQGVDDSSRAPKAGGSQNGPNAAALRDRWPEVLDAVRDVRKVAWILLSTAAVESVDGSLVTVAFLREGDAKGFGTSGCDQDLADVLSDMFGARLTIRAVAKPTRQNAPDARRDNPRPAGERRNSAPRGGADLGNSGGIGARPAQSGQASMESGPGPGDDASPSTGPVPADNHANRRRNSREQAVGTGTGRGRETGSASDSGRGSEAGRRGRTRRDPNSGPGGSDPAVSAPDDPRPLTDADPADRSDPVTGTDLVLRELGGQLIQETGED